MAPACGVLLGGPTVLAFFSGGFFDRPRLVAAIVAWGLVLVAMVAGPRPLPASRPARAALAGLLLLIVWGAASLAWAPVAARATDDLVRMLMYLGALLAAAALFPSRAGVRVVEPALALGTVIVIGYGLSGRLLPGVIDLHASTRAFGRLEQPLTYWNAEGLLAAMGVLLCARLAGDPSRTRAMRALAAACCVPLGAGLYLSLSRGAIAAAAVGLCMLASLVGNRAQLRAVALAALAAAAAGAIAAAFPGVAGLEGSPSDREADGAVLLALFGALMVASALACQWIAGAEQRGRLNPHGVSFVRPLRMAVVVALALTAVGLVAGGLGERGEARVEASGRSERLVSVKSRRYDYWRIGADAFADNPVKGVGLGGFSVVWLRERPVREGAADAHSLPLETGAELGVVGLLALGLFLGGVGFTARRLAHHDPQLLAGGIAAMTAWALHASIDWDWEMPAVTLPVVVLAGVAMSAADIGRSPVSGPGDRAEAPDAPPLATDAGRVR
jgi:hypothetical protein